MQNNIDNLLSEVFQNVRNEKETNETQGKSMSEAYQALNESEKKLYDELHNLKRHTSAEEAKIMVNIVRGAYSKEKFVQMAEEIYADFGVEDMALYMIIKFPLLSGHFNTLCDLAISHIQKSWNSYVASRGKEIEHQAVFTKFAEKYLWKTLYDYKNRIYNIVPVRRQTTELLLEKYYNLQRKYLGIFGIMASDDNIAQELGITLEKAQELTALSRANV